MEPGSSKSAPVGELYPAGSPRSTDRLTASLLGQFLSQNASFSRPPLPRADSEPQPSRSPGKRPLAPQRSFTSSSYSGGAPTIKSPSRDLPDCSPSPSVASSPEQILRDVECYFSDISIRRRGSDESDTLTTPDVDDATLRELSYKAPGRFTFPDVGPIDGAWYPTDPLQSALRRLHKSADTSVQQAQTIFDRFVGSGLSSPEPDDTSVTSSIPPTSPGLLSPVSWPWSFEAGFPPEPSHFEPQRPRAVPREISLYGAAKPEETGHAVRQLREHVPASRASCEEGGVMSNNAFGAAIRTKVAQILEHMCASVPRTQHPDHDQAVDGDSGEVVSIVEYGAEGSQSASLVKPVIEALERREVVPSGTVRPSDDMSSRHSRCSSSSYVVTHASLPATDTRPLSALSESSYQDEKWQAAHTPSLVDSVFSVYTNRGFGTTAVPKATVSVGFSIMEMQRAFTKRALGVTDAQHAHAELRTFLKARAAEFRRGGFLVVAFPLDRHAYEKAIAPHLKSSLEHEPHLPFEPTSPCLWQSLERLIFISIRTLVLRGLVRPSAASAMQSFPMHSRTARETRELLASVRDDWKVEWACGLGTDVDGDLSDPRPVVEPPLRLTHPAQTALENGAIGVPIWAEHAASFIRACYDPFCRAALVADAKSAEERAQAEIVIEELWEDVGRRIADGGLKEIELEVGVVGLRRK